ncbi:hypothetical protein ACFLZM_06690 [Thermodesulfobacteriota bacterium]
MKSFNYLIDYQCPQCGAPAVLKETDRLFTCGFCRASSYLIPEDFFRLILPSRAAGDKPIFYYPYWRFRGMQFTCTLEGVTHRFIDISHQAVESHHFPISVGLRSQTLNMQLASAETKGRFLRPTLSIENVISVIEKRVNGIRRDPVILQAHIGETLSLIYSPYYIEDKIYDAVLDAPTSSRLPKNFDIQSQSDENPNWPIRLIPTLCPICGWDLQGESDTLVLSCQNCSALWKPDKKGFKRLEFAYIAGTGDNMIYLPFWRIKAEISGIELESYADLVKIANLPKAPQSGWADIPFYFWAPAFKVPPRNFLNLMRSLTLSQPRQKMIKEMPAGNLYPVKLPITEAVECLKIILASFIKPPERHLPRLNEISINPKRYLLIYIPFQIRQNELIQSKLHMTINKNLLELAGN